MKNFILFIVAVSILSFAGFVLYRVYYKGESAGEVFRELRGGEEEPDVLAEAEDAYDRKDYVEAARGFEIALEAHESGEPGATLDEREHKKVLSRIAFCYKRMWESGGKTDDELRIKALRTYKKYCDEYPNTSHRNIGRMMGELRKPTSAPAEETTVVDESPP